MGRSILRVSTIDKFFNCVFFFYYNLVTFDKGYSLIVESLVSNISLDSLPKFYIVGYALRTEITVEILLRFS